MIAAVVAVAAGIGILSTRGASGLELAAPVVLLFGAGLVILSWYQFEWFVLSVLALRTLVDVTKIRPAANRLPSSTGFVEPGNAPAGRAAAALGLLFIIASVVWLLRQAGKRADAGQGLSPLEAAFVFFLTTCGLSVLNSVKRSASLSECARILAAVLMFFVLIRLMTTLQKVRRFLLACFLSMLPPILLGIYQAVSGKGRFVTAGLSRIVGTFLHPNTLGFFLAMMMLMMIAIYRHCGSREQKMIACAVPIGCILLGLTYSRGAWVSFVVGLVLIAVLQSRRIFLWMMGGSVLAVLAVPSLLARLSNLTTGDTVTGSSGNSLIWRFRYWSDVSALNHNSLITGIGLKGTRFITVQNKAPHNDFLRAYAETGMLGLLAFVVVVVALVGVSRRALRAAQPGFPRGVAVGFAAVLAAYIIDSLGDNLLSEVVVVWYFYAFAACAVVVTRLRSSAVLDHAMSV